jgi:hypothetical protein
MKRNGKVYNERTLAHAKQLIKFFAPDSYFLPRDAYTQAMAMRSDHDALVRLSDYIYKVSAANRGLVTSDDFIDAVYFIGE